MMETSVNEHSEQTEDVSLLLVHFFTGFIANFGIK